MGINRRIFGIPKIWTKIRWTTFLRRHPTKFLVGQNFRRQQAKISLI